MGRIKNTKSFASNHVWLPGTYPFCYIQLKHKYYQTWEVKQCRTVITESGDEGNQMRLACWLFWLSTCRCLLNHGWGIPSKTRDFTTLGRQRQKLENQRSSKPWLPFGLQSAFYFCEGQLSRGGSSPSW